MHISLAQNKRRLQRCERLWRQLMFHSNPISVTWNVVWRLKLFKKALFHSVIHIRTNKTKQKVTKSPFYNCILSKCEVFIMPWYFLSLFLTFTSVLGIFKVLNNWIAYDIMTTQNKLSVHLFCSSAYSNYHWLLIHNPVDIFFSSYL